MRGARNVIELPDFLEQGERARLFPVLSESNRERRITSIFLAMLTQVQPFAKSIFDSIDIRVGSRTRIRTFTEVVLRRGADGKDRPDGLIVISSGSRQWSALVETKIGRSQLDGEQVERYLKLARVSNIDAVITISNQFVARAHISPVNVSKSLLRKVDLFHWSWPWITTQCEILHLQNAVEDREQAFLVDQFLDFLLHPGTGVERFTMMGPGWKGVVQDVTNGETLKKSAPEVKEVVESWFAEMRDLSLHMSTDLGVHVSEKIPRNLAKDPAARLKSGIEELVEQKQLSATFSVPDAASDITVRANLLTRTISASMKLKAPTDRKSTKARVNWLLRMLGEDDERLLLRAHWPGRTPSTTKQICELRRQPDAIQSEKPGIAPHTFEVILLERTGKRFASRKTFIEDLERIASDFYTLAGSKLRAWQPSPPKPVKNAEISTGRAEHRTGKGDGARKVESGDSCTQDHRIVQS